MKKLLIALFISSLFFVSSAFAIDIATKGAKVDAPNLIKLSNNWSIGGEVGKNLAETNTDQDWFVFAKVTYSGSLLDFSKK